MRKDKRDYEFCAPIIAYIDGRAICMDEFGDFLFCELPEEFVVVGEAILLSDLMPIGALPPNEQKKIINTMKAMPSEQLTELLESTEFRDLMGVDNYE